MATDDKTEKATPKRQTESRKKGQVAKSQELNSVVVLGMGLIGVMAIGPKVVSSAAGTMRAAFALIAKPHAPHHRRRPARAARTDGVTRSCRRWPRSPRCVWPGRSWPTSPRSASGPRFTPLKPDFKKLNPVTGVQERVRQADRVPDRQGAGQGRSSSARVAAMTLVPMLTNLSANVGTYAAGPRQPAELQLDVDRRARRDRLPADRHRRPHLAPPDATPRCSR